MKPAIVLLLQMQTGGAANFTARADRRCEAAKRKAAQKRPPTRKAWQVSLNMLRSMVSKYMTQFKNNIGEADIFKIRCVTKMVVEYFTFCRFCRAHCLRGTTRIFARCWWSSSTSKGWDLDSGRRRVTARTCTV